MGIEDRPARARMDASMTCCTLRGRGDRSKDGEAVIELILENK